MPVAAVTRLRLRPSTSRLRFFWYSLISIRQARRAEGHLGSAVLRNRPGEYWTLSVWRDTAVMRAFMSSGAHRKAMPHLTHWCEEAASAHWQQDNADLPSLETAAQGLAQHGRNLKVQPPAAAPAAGLPLGPGSA